MAKKTGVYKISNKINNKIYIGSSKNIYYRWTEHRRELRNNKHHSYHLQKAWNKYGEQNFKFSIVEECNEDKLLEREQYYLDLYKSYNSKIGYNISKNALAPMKGRKFSQETLKKLSEGVRSRDSSCWVKGEDRFNAKFKNEDIINIKRMIYEGIKIIDIANMYNVAPNTITNIKTGERWTHIKTEYDNLIIQTPKQKITENDVIEIKKLLIENNLTLKQIAEIYDITFGMVSAIKNLRSWENIGKEYNDKLKYRSNVRKLNKDKVKEIKEDFKKGMSDKDIAEIFNVDRATINDIKNNRIWKEVS